MWNLPLSLLRKINNLWKSFCNKSLHFKFKAIRVIFESAKSKKRFVQMIAKYFDLKIFLKVFFINFGRILSSIWLQAIWWSSICWSPKFFEIGRIINTHIKVDHIIHDRYIILWSLIRFAIESLIFLVKHIRWSESTFELNGLLADLLELIF